MADKSAQIKEFDTLLVKYTKTTKQSVELAQKCSNIALLHFQEHGNLVLCQRFLEAIPKNYSRPAAFIGWLVKHAPVTMIEGKTLVKDKERAQKEGDAAWDIAGALAKPFWEAIPNKEKIHFDVENVDQQFMRVANRFLSERYVPDSDEAVERVTKIRLMLQHIDEIKLPVADNDDESDASDDSEDDAATIAA